MTTFRVYGLLLAAATVAAINRFRGENAGCAPEQCHLHYSGGAGLRPRWLARTLRRLPLRWLLWPTMLARSLRHSALPLVNHKSLAAQVEQLESRVRFLQ